MQPVNYGWVIVGVGVLVKATGLGFGRFAYPVLLPSMKETLGFSYSQMGLLSGGIMLGYLLFSFAAGRLATHFGSKRVVVTALLCSSVSMFLLSKASGFAFMLLLAFAMGAGAAGAHIAMTTLPMNWFERHRLGKAVGVVTGGTGLGIVIVSLLVPFFFASLGKEAWRDCWRLMALITFLVFLTGICLLKEKAAVPESSSLERGGGKRDEAPPPEKKEGLSLRSVIVVYFIFGFSYNIYATYFVAYMVDELHVVQGTAGVIWSVFGWTCMVSGLIWGFISDRLGRKKALLWNNGIISVAVFLPLYFHQMPVLGFSIFLFGATFLGTVTIIAASIGDQVFEKQAAVYGLVTLLHGIGQFTGTTFGGFLKDLSGSFQLTFISSLIGFLLCLALTALSTGKGRSGECEQT